MLTKVNDPKVPWLCCKYTLSYNNLSHLKLLSKCHSVKHQLTDIGCPWQNGRIERFFGTLKEKLNQILIKDSTHLNFHLTEFRFWYNHVRTHMNLDGRTPNEVWLNKGIKPEAQFYEAWGGLLKGYLHPLDG